MSNKNENNLENNTSTKPKVNFSCFDQNISIKAVRIDQEGHVNKMIKSMNN